MPYRNLKKNILCDFPNHTMTVSKKFGVAGLLNGKTKRHKLQKIRYTLVGILKGKGKLGVTFNSNPKIKIC